MFQRLSSLCEYLCDVAINEENHLLTGNIYIRQYSGVVASEQPTERAEVEKNHKAKDNGKCQAVFDR